MEDECSFQPQINSRSRRLARHAPSLRERQEHDELLRSSAKRGEAPPAQRSPRQASRRSIANACSSDSKDNSVVESVWSLWRAVASSEARPEEAAYVNPRASSSRSPSSCPAAALQTPPVVHVSTVLGMLHSLGIRPPSHAALIAKFLAAMGVEEKDAADGVVEADRFVYVVATVWKAAVTNRARQSPAASPASISPDAGPPSGLSARSSAEDAEESAGSYEAVSEAADTSDREVEKSCASAVEDEAEPEQTSDDDFFLHTNMSDSNLPSPSTTPGDADEHPHPDAKQRASFPSAQSTPGLSLSPEARNPQVARSPTAAAPPSLSSWSHRRSPFSSTPVALRSSASSSMQQRRGPSSSSTCVLPGTSHLLMSTASCELKKETKRVPGGLMRECTFKPAINQAPSSTTTPLRPSPGDIMESKKRTHQSSAPPSFQSDTQQRHRQRAKPASWADRPVNERMYPSNGGLNSNTVNGSGAEALQEGPAPMAPGFDTAVRRMIAARRQQQQLQHQAWTPQPVRQTSHRTSAVRHADTEETPAERQREQPLLYVDVDLPHGKAGRIALFRGDDARGVAQRFCVRHSLDDTLCGRLEGILHDQLRALANQR